MIQATQPEEDAPNTSARFELPASSSSASRANASPGNASSSNSVRRWALGASSLAFAVLQSIYSALVAVSGFRLLVGFSSLAAILGARIPLAFHANWIRIPMLSLALAGALFNLYAVRRVRKLRSRPAAQWRTQPVSPAKLRSENLQILLALATLLLILVEEFLHIFLHHVF